MAERKKAKPCPYCLSPDTVADILFRAPGRTFPPILDGCLTCKAVWKSDSEAELIAS